MSFMFDIIKGLLYIIFCIALIWVARIKMKQLVKPENESMNILNYYLYMSMIACLLFLIAITLTIMAYNIIKTIDEMKDHEEKINYYLSIQIMATCILDGLVQVSYNWVIWF